MSNPADEGAWTVRRAMTWTTGHFERRDVDAPRLTAELLLAHVLKVDRVRLYVDLDRPLEKPELARYRGLIERRVSGEPTQYLTGIRPFYGRTFRVDPRVLIPRPETELLVEAALRHLPKNTEARVLDLCTGSGCVAISIAAERQQVHVSATDLSEDACAVARENAAALGVTERVDILQGDLSAPVRERGPFHVVVSNPPYIASAEIRTLSREVQREPRGALDGGPDGLRLLARVAEESLPLLVDGGLLAVEIGDTQGPAVRELFVSAGFRDVGVEPDLERRDRLVLGYRPPRSA